MSELHNKRAAEILNRILYVTIASVSEDGQPWNSPVYSAFDKELNFYWSSDKDSQHSKNIRHNGKVFLVIYDSTAPPPAGEGVYIQATAYELDEHEEIIITKDEPIKFTGDAVRRVYKAVPQKIWMSDEEKDGTSEPVRDIRVEVLTEEIKKYLTS